MSGASEWAAWAALGLSLILLGVLVGVVVLGLRFWQKVRPTVEPMLQMFAPAPSGVDVQRVVDAIEVGEHDGGALP